MVGCEGFEEEDLTQRRRLGDEHAEFWGLSRLDFMRLLRSREGGGGGWGVDHLLDRLLDHRGEGAGW